VAGLMHEYACWGVAHKKCSAHVQHDMLPLPVKSGCVHPMRRQSPGGCSLLRCMRLVQWLLLSGVSCVSVGYVCRCVQAQQQIAAAQLLVLQSMHTQHYKHCRS
jgi:hypothetical protein